MPNNNFRVLPARQFSTQGYVPSSLTALISNGTVWITSLVFSNITSSDVTLTLTDNESSPLTLYSNLIPAGDSRSFTYEEGWEFTNGIRWGASAGSSIYMQILGRQKG